MKVEQSTNSLPHPGRDEVLLKVRSVGICGTDIHITNGAIPSAKPPMILGHEISGEVAETGQNVGRVHEGDRVSVDSVVGCGHCTHCRQNKPQFCAKGFEFGISRDGGCQDYLVVPKRNVHRIPNTITFEEAAILDTEVYNAVRRCGVDQGDSVLVLGAGPIGLVACQIARILGAGYVVLRDVLSSRVGAAEALGVADRYLVTEEDETQTAKQGERPEGFDLVIDCAGTPESVRMSLTLARPSGRVLLYGVHEREVDHLDLNLVVLKDLAVFGAQGDRNGWQTVIDLVAGGTLNLKGLITHRFPLVKGAEAYELVRRREQAVIKAVLLV